jgi:hypothetical protein
MIVSKNLPLKGDDQVDGSRLDPRDVLGCEFENILLLEKNLKREDLKEEAGASELHSERDVRNEV